MPDAKTEVSASDRTDEPLARVLRETGADTDRFVIDRVAGRGGMGVVFRATDRLSGDLVAFKVLAGDDGDATRFAREVRLLSDLDHPAIVRYVAHGVTRAGKPYLAMEWLDGEDLAVRLGRGGLAVAEAIALLHRLAAGLAAAHARGVVHRDIKPSNVLLVGGDPGRAKLLDFGIARVHAGQVTAALTRSGVLLGTVGYMAPEQALADERIDARADVFSLGAVLFECLTGVPAFAARQVVGVLAKVLREDAPRLRHLRPELPASLDDLVARMLSRDPAGRPRDAGEVVTALASLGLVSGGAPSGTPLVVPRISNAEQRFVSVILATGIAGEGGRPGDVVQSFGGDVLRLVNGVLVVIFESPSAPNEQALRAGACALAVRDAFPGARIALVTGRTATGRDESPATVVERAVSLLVGAGGDPIRVDTLTAAFLENRFEIGGRDEALTLRGPVGEADGPPRTLLGRATPCIGREKELALLEATWRECLGEAVPRAVVVVGPPGQGKSRLRHEFVARLRAREEVRVVLARADAVGAGSTFLIVRQILWQTVGGDAQTAEAIVRARAGALFAEAEAGRITEFLLEQLGLSSSVPPTPQLRVARNDPQIMASWLRQSFGEWLAAESASKPLLVVVEDVHWADMPSLTYLGDALRSASARELMVLALARPEVKTVFPNLCATLDAQEVALGRLTPAAAEKLVRAATADPLSAETIGRIVRRAEGNAFYLEELVRYVAEGGAEGLPDTVLAVAQSRLHQLTADDRRLVRAASVFGEVFWRGGVEHLLGARARDPFVEEALEGMVSREVFEARRSPRFAGEKEYRFRHALLREAAYATLTDGDRATGHALAGAWLEGVGALDPLVLADHFEAGGQPARALPWLMRAQQAAYDGGNVPAVLALAARGAACGAAAEDLGTLRLTEGMALTLQSSWTRVAGPCAEAMTLLPRGSTRWFLAASMAFVAGMFLGDAGTTVSLLQEILGVEVQPELSGPYGMAVFGVCIGLIGLGQTAMARAFVERVWSGDEDPATTDPAFVLRLQITVGFLRMAEGDLASALSLLAQATKLAERAGDAWGRASSATQYAGALAESGLVERVEATARDNLAYCERTGLSLFFDWTQLYLARAWTGAGRLAEAEALARVLLGRPDPLLVANARALLGELLAAAGRLAEAESEATRALEEGYVFPAVQAAARAVLARAALAGGRPAEALVHAGQGLDAAALSVWPRDLSALRLARAEALFAAGRVAEAREAIEEARQHVARVGGSFGDPATRLAYETFVGANARTLALAADWLAGSA